MNQKTVSLVGCLMVVGLISFPSMAGITLRANRPLKAQSIQVTTYLSDENKSLEKALQIHNLLNEMSELRYTAQTTENLKKQGDIFKEMQEKMTSCNVQKLGKVFKDPQKVWANMTKTYEEKRQISQKEIESEKKDKLTLSLKERQKNDTMGWRINREIMMDVYENPKKWGDVNAGESFPLWQDQIVLFEKDWNQFYENLNAAYGVPLKGRPAVDEETRHNAAKYDAVLAAHKAYISQLNREGRPTNPEIAKANPPKAPKALPKWQDIVRIDPISGKPMPELPEPWKKMSENKFKNYADGGEMSQAFSGKSLTPTPLATANQKGDLEAEYEMMLTADMLDKGVESSLDSQKRIVQAFLNRVKEFGIDTKDFDISNRSQYMRVQKQLKELKKAAIEEAYKYTEQLEKQDKENPNYVARREKLKAQKRARLSAQAQAATTNLSDGLQVSQMAPAVQQRLVLAALEKDANSSVYLTQTNALNIDQLMREQKSTDKIIAESYKQMDTSFVQQREAMPMLTECHF